MARETGPRTSQADLLVKRSACPGCVKIPIGAQRRGLRLDRQSYVGQLFWKK